MKIKVSILGEASGDAFELKLIDEKSTHHYSFLKMKL
ncbi:hypothetical protein BANRA_00343 [Escherichia coli]|nr:hypothetical protein BANRA_00343 [Escherichia coli]